MFTISSLRGLELLALLLEKPEGAILMLLKLESLLWLRSLFLGELLSKDFRLISCGPVKESFLSLGKALKSTGLLLLF
jgi:hypothetical protein